MAVVCDPIKMGRWSELMVVCVCHSDEVMREADANDTSERIGGLRYQGVLWVSLYLGLTYPLHPNVGHKATMYLFSTDDGPLAIT